MRKLVSRALISMLGLVWVLGYDDFSAPSLSQNSNDFKILTNRVEAAQPNLPPASSKPKTAKKPAKKESGVLDNADPKTIFVVTGVGKPVEIAAQDGLIPAIKYEVAFGGQDSSSSKYSIDSIGTSTQPQNLIGKGTPKAGFKLPKGFTEFKPTGYDASGLPLRIVCTKTETQLALVPAGTSIVGTENGPEDCKPSYTVSLDTFYMEVMEVTVQNYEKYRAELREKKKPLPPTPSNLNAASDYPVLGVTWAGAQAYVRWAGMELPTEAEFEKAARGPKGLRTPWGDGKPLWGNRALTKTGSYAEDTSPYGILDLAGNAKEWCADLYSPTAHSEAATASVKETLHNWPGPKKVREMSLRVIKGNGPDWSAWYREGKDMQKSQNEVGFRGVLRITLDSKPASTSKNRSDKSDK